jgi:branched-chain amino acid aminotransferase
VIDPIVWWNGALAAASEVRISPFDHGLLVGDGVFETIRVYGGQPFAWRRHLDRLEHSARGLGLAVPDRAELRDAAERVLAANGLTEARLRITLTGGLSPLGSERGEAEPTVLLAASAADRGARATTVAMAPWARNERGATAGLKTISYAENVRALTYARERGATEALLVNTHDDLCEATGSNLFLVHDGVVRTPPASAGCLLGVTRALVLELCPTIGFVAEEVPLLAHALDDADEAFLTSTVREVQGIAEIADGRRFEGAPGPITRALADAFEALVARTLDP